MKDYRCDSCGTQIKVDDEYEPQLCCSGLAEQCACMGMPINPIFCDECVERMYGKHTRIDEIFGKPSDNLITTAELFLPWEDEEE